MTRRASSGSAPRIGPHRKAAHGSTDGRADGSADGSGTQCTSDNRKGVARR